MATFARGFVSITDGPSPDGSTDSLNLVSTWVGGHHWLEVLSPFPSDLAQVNETANLDAFVVPPVADMIDADTIRVYGLHHLVGYQATVWAAGVDLGEFCVPEGGYLDLPLNEPGSLFTTTRIQELTDNHQPPGLNFYAGLGVHVNGFASGGSSAPVVANSIALFNDRPDVANFSYDAVYQLWVDWDNAKAYVVARDSPGAFDPSYLKRIDLLTGQQEDEVINTEFSGNSIRGGIFYNGSIYLSSSATSSTAFTRVDPTTLAVTPFATGVPEWSGLCGLQGTGGGPHLLAVGQASSDEGNPGQVYLVRLDTLTTLGSPTAIDENQATLVQDRTNGGRFFAVGYARPGFGDETDPIGLYRFDVAGTTPTKTNIAKVDPSDVDAAWTAWSNGSFDAPIFDETDGNIIMPLSRSAGAGEAAYLVKFNVATGAIIWQTPLAAVFDSGMLEGGGGVHTRSRYGQLTYYDSGISSLLVIDTSDGSITDTIPLGGISAMTQCATDDVTGGVIFFGAYNSGAVGAPTPVNGNTTSASSQWFLLGPLTIVNTDFYIPIVVGLNYESEGQILRPIIQQNTGALNGPALAKTRREHQYGVLLNRTQGIEFGTDFGDLKTANLRQPDGTPYTLVELYSGVFHDILQDDYGYDSMLAWRITRPYPATVLAVGPFIATQDR